MFRFSVQCVLLLLLACRSYAQLWPAENSKLNYRIIGFSFPAIDGAAGYTVRAAAGNYDNVDSFMKHATLSFESVDNRVVGEVPSFGGTYTWQVTPGGKMAVSAVSQLHHFSTLIVPDVDTNITRLRILKRATAYKDAYIFLDANRTLYDMDGHAVWFVPIVDGAVADNFPSYGDVKLTPQHTMTFITNRKQGNIYELNYNGGILWKGPNDGKVNGDSLEFYNHEFTRLSNGHYMVLGSEYELMKLPGKVDSFVLKRRESKGKIIWDAKANAFYERVQFATLIEYDEDRNIVWSWRSSAYFKAADLYNHTNMMGIYDIDDVHENSFYYDEGLKAIYISFRNMSRIIKLSYPDGKVIKVYGKQYSPGSPGYDNELFHHQHSVRITTDGYLSVYNNNNRHPGSLPTLLLMKEPVTDQDTLTKVWEYTCTTDGIDTALRQPPEFAGLGCTMELPDKSMLACMTTDDYTRIFIVNRDKKTLWSAIPERWVAAYHKWSPVLEYKPSIILDRKALERWIWNAQPGPAAK